MDLWIVVAILLIVLWAVGTFVLAVGGWIHLLLTVGVFLLLYRIVVRGTSTPRESTRREVTPPR
jgi:uncharacterized membrane protein